jgi:hypothetical protein
MLLTEAKMGDILLSEDKDLRHFAREEEMDIRSQRRM